MTWHAEVFSLVPTGLMGNGLMIYWQDSHGGKIARVKPFTLEETDPGKYISSLDYTMVDSRGAWNGEVAGTDIGDFLQTMLELAWKKGLRPKNAEYGDLQLKAVRDHLADMQKLVFESK